MVPGTLLQVQKMLIFDFQEKYTVFFPINLCTARKWSKIEKIEIEKKIRTSFSFYPEVSLTCSYLLCYNL